MPKLPTKTRRPGSALQRPIAATALALCLASARPVVAQSVVPSAESVVTLIAPSEPSRDAMLEVFGPAAREIYRHLERGRVPRAQQRTAYGPHTTLRGAAIECEFPAFAQDVPVYRCHARVRADGGFAPTGTGPALEAREIAALQDAGAAVATTRGALVYVGFSGRPARELRAHVRLDGRSETDPSRGAVTCGLREFPSDVPRLLSSCGFAVDRSGAVVVIPHSTPVN